MATTRERIFAATQDAEFMRQFWEKVDRRGDDECWPWTAGKSSGYGAAYRPPDLGPVAAHRIAWSSVHGLIPPRLSVRHRCDNPPCCNPAHLVVGTHAENMADKRIRDRQKGERAPHSRLADEDVREIRRRREAGETLTSIGAAFGVTRQNVHFIVTRQTWAHL